MRGVMAAIGAALLLSMTGCALEPDCPDCEDQCWEGEPQCKKCKKKHSCPVEADTQDVLEEPAPELPLT